MSLLDAQHATRDLSEPTAINFYKRNKFTPRAIPSRSGMTYRDELADCKAAIFEWITHSQLALRSRSFYCLGENARNLLGATHLSKQALILQMHRTPDRFQAYALNEEHLKQLLTTANSMSVTGEEKRALTRIAYLALCTIASVPHPEHYLGGVTLIDLFQRYFEELGREQTINRQVFDFHVSLMKRFDPVLKTVPRDTIAAFVKVMSRTMENSGGHYKTEEMDRALYMLSKDAYPEFLTGFIVQELCNKDLKELGWFDKFLNFLGMKGNEKQQSKVIETLTGNLKRSMFANPQTALVNMVTRPTESIEKKAFDFITSPNASKVPQFKDLGDWIQVSFYRIFTELVNKLLPCSLGQELYLAEAETLRLFESCQAHDKLTMKDYTPQGLNKEALSQVLKESNEGLLKAKEHRGLLEKLSDPTQLAFSMLDQRSIGSDYKRLADDKSLTIGQVASIGTRLKDCAATFRTTSLIDVKAYQELLQSAADDSRVQKQSSLSLRDFDRLCLEVEEKLRALLVTFVEGIEYKLIDRFLKLQHDILLQKKGPHGENINLLVENHIITEPQRETLVHMLNLICLLIPAEEMQVSFGKIYSTLKDKKLGAAAMQRTEGQDPLSVVINKVVKIGHNLKSTGRIQLDVMAHFCKQELELMEFLHRNDLLLLKLGDCMEVLKHFAEKDNKHFEEIYFEADGAIKIEPHITSSALTLVTAYKSKDLFSDLESFLKEVTKKSHQIHAADLALKSKDLIECSKTLLADNLDGKNSAFEIMDGSVMVFKVNQSLVYYEVYCETNIDLVRLKERGLGKAPATKPKQKCQKEIAAEKQKAQKIIEFEKLQDTKIKVSLYKDHLKRQQPQAFVPQPTDTMEMEADVGAEPSQQILAQDTKRIDLFERIIDSVQSISDSLHRIVRSGSIYDLTAILQTQVATLAKSESAAVRDGSQALDYYCYTEALTLCVQTHRMAHLGGNRPALQTQQNHFEVLKEVFEAIATKAEQQMMSKDLIFHNIRFLRSFQRIMICRYLEFNEVKGTTDQQDQDLTLLVSIFKFMLPSLIPSEITPKQVKKWRQMCSNMRSLDGFTENLLVKFQKELVQESSNMTNSSRGQLEIPQKPAAGQDFEDTQKKIKFFKTTEQNQFKNLLDLASLKGEKQLQPQRIFFGDQQTSIFDLKNFLICALTDPHRQFYALLDLHLLSSELQGEMVLVCKTLLQMKDFVVNDNITILVASKESRLSELHQHLARSPEYFASDNQENRSVQNNLLPDLHVVTSARAGLGKTTYIEKKASGNSKDLCTIILSGESCKQGLVFRLTKLANSSRTSGRDLLLHIKLDSMDDMQISCKYVDQFLFNLVCLKCVPFNQGFLFTERIKATYVEVQNSYKAMILENVRMLSFVKALELPDLKVASFKRDFQPTLATRTFDRPEDPDMMVEAHPDQHFSNSEMWAFLGAFLDAYKNKNFGTQRIEAPAGATRDMSQEKLANQVLDLMKIISSNEREVEALISQASYTQINYWLNTVYFQMSELNKVAGLDPTSYQEQGSRQVSPVLRDLATIREKTGKSVIELAKQLVWSVADTLRRESALAKKIAKEAGSNGLSSSQEKELKDYEALVKSIPKWELGSNVNYFFYQGAMKIIYQNPERVDQSIREIVKNQTKQELLDYRRIPTANEKLAQELIQALSMETDVALGTKLAGHDRWRAVPRDKRISEYLSDQMRTFNQKGYVITHDSYMKILMIVQRAILGIPVVIMGGTGCGKTYMIDFIGSCLFQETFECFTLHTGVTEQDLTRKLLAVLRLANTPEMASKRIWFLFDEFNTSPLQSLITEIIIERRSSFCPELAGKVFPLNIIFVAACNPFRIKVQTSDVGLIHESSVSLLSHRVYPIPESLISNIWDFGQLTKEVEEQYIESMVSTSAKVKNSKIKGSIIKSIQICQEHFRSGTCHNTVSLRDVNRFIELFDFLKKYFTLHQSLVMTIALCYIFRLETKQEKKKLSDKLDRELGSRPAVRGDFGRTPAPDTMDADAVAVEPESKQITTVMKECLDGFAADLRGLKILPPGVMLNKPLLENLFATWVCILTNTPLIICGKPGTSKTLSIRVIGDALNLQHGRRADSVYFGNAPRVTYRNFWGSLTTTSTSIGKIFEKAENIIAQDRFSEANQVCIVFDEIGLAEIAPDNPLKVLHPLLEPKERRVGFIGLSNWRLDLSKMNRVLYVARPDMDWEDLNETCDVNVFIKSLNNASVRSRFKTLITDRFESLSKAYEKFRDKEMSIKGPGTHPNFHGSRDFYETVKIFKHNFQLIFDQQSDLTELQTQAVEDELDLEDQELVDGLVLNALQRNFSGKVFQDAKSHEVIMKMYLEQIKRHGNSKVASAPAIELIYQNLLDETSRHLMILSSMNFVQDLIIQQITEFETTSRKKDTSKVVYLVPSKDKEDMIQVIKSKLPVYIKNGYTVIMKDLNELYGCMYDLLNRNYSKREGELACDLFIDNISQQVIVHPQFKCIILMDELDKAATGKDIEKKQQPPFFNRFEKYIITEEDFIPRAYVHVKNDLLKKLQISKESGKTSTSAQYLHHNLSREMVFSIVVKDTSEVKKKLKFEQKDQMSILKLLLEQTTKRSKKNKGAAEDMEEDHSGIEDPEVEEKLIRLHSRNALLLREINAKEVTDCKQYHNIFMKTHPHDSLLDLQATLETNPSNKRAVVFTYSSGFELKEIVEKYAKTFHLLEAGELYRRYTSRQESCFREVLLENEKTLLVQFTKKKDWKLMQQIKFGIDKAILETKKAKPIIFVAQYIHGDFKLQMDEFHCGITYFTENWQMHVIDNLKSCKYEQFLQTLHKKCYEVLDQDSKEHIQDAISKHFLHNSKDYADVVRGDSCKQLISQNVLLVSMIREDTLRSIKMDKVGKDTVIKMLENKAKKNVAQLFGDHNDCHYLVQDLLKELFVTQIQKAIQKVEESVNIRDLILLKNLHPGNEKFITEFLEVTTATETNYDQQAPNRTSQFDQRTSANILGAIKASKAKTDDIVKESRRHVVELQNRLSGITQGGVANLERLNEYFAQLRATITMFSKEKYFEANKHLTETKDPRFALLAAIRHFKLFLANHYQHLQQYPIFEIVLYTSVQILARLYPLRSSHECDYTYREAITTLLLVTKIYSEEFGALSSVIQESNQHARELEKTLKSDIIESIMSKGIIELQQYIKSIQKLKEITGDTKSGLESQLKKIELSYRLSMLVKNRAYRPGTSHISGARGDTMMDMDEASQGSTPRDSTVPEISVAFSDHQIAMKVIRYIEKTPGNPGKALLKFYNEICREMQGQSSLENPFGDYDSQSSFITFSIEFLRRIFEQHDIPSIVGGKLLSEISSHLLEIDQQEPMGHFEKIVGVLLAYLKHKLKNPPKLQQQEQDEQLNPFHNILELDQETKPEIIMLSKLAIFNIFPDNQDPPRVRFNVSDVLTRQINRELAEFDPQTRKRFYQKLNHRIICFACASAHIFANRDGQIPLQNIAEKVRTIQSSLFAETSTVFDAKTITAYAVFKNLLQRLKDNTNNLDSVATPHQKSQAVDFAAVQQLDEECARVSAPRRSESDKEFGLVLFHAIYSVIPSIRQLRARGLNELAARIQKLQDLSDREFVLPDMNLYNELKAFITGIPFQQELVDPLTVTPEMAIQFIVPPQFADQMRHMARQPQLAAPRHQATLDTFHLGVHLANKFLSPQPSMDEVRSLLDRVQDAPYRPFIDALMNKAFTATDPEPAAASVERRNPFETTMMDSDTAPGPQQPPQQAPLPTHFRKLEPVAEGSIKENMPFYLSVGLVLNFVANLPQGFIYSAKTSVQTLQTFQPLLNYPGPEVSRMQVISRFYELSRNTVRSAAGNIFTALWECATPNCGYLVPIGDCGNLGHGTTDNISSVCPGCKRPIGTLGNGNSNLIRRDLNQSLISFRDHLSRDETPYRPEPKQPDGKLADKFDDSWVLMKYYEDISDRSTAIFVNFVQNVIIYGMQTQNALNPFDNLLDLQERRMTDTEKLLKRDYELLRDVLGRDDQSLFEIFNLVFFKIYNEIQSGLHDAATPRGLRSKLGKGFSSVALLDKDKRPSRALEQYYAIKQKVLKSEGERNIQILALLSGKLSAEVIKNKFTSDQVFGFYLNKADAKVNLQMIDAKLDDQMKSVTQDSDPKVILRCSFLQHIVSNRKILTNLRTILIGLRRFSMFMTQRYDSLFTKEVAKNTPLGDLMKQPTVRYGKSRSVTDERIAANAEDLQQEFESFATLVQKMVLGEDSICEQIRSAFKFECQKVDEALMYIKSLTDKRTSLIYFLIYEDSTEEIPMMKMLMEALIEFQTNWIDKFSEISNDIGSIGTKSIKANLLTCPEDSVMCLPSSFERDLYRHSYANTAGLNTRSTLVIDVNFLSSKYATCLFGQSHQLIVVGLFSFQDSKNRQLSTLVDKFCAKFKIEPEEDLENVASLEDFREGVKGLVVSLKILLSKALETQNTQADVESEQEKLKAYHRMAKLTVLNQEDVEILPDELSNYRMKDLQILRRLIDLCHFPSMVEQVQKKYPQSQLTKAQFTKNYEKQVKEAQETNFIPGIQQAERDLKLVFMNALPMEMLDDEGTKQRLDEKAEHSLEDRDLDCLRDALLKLNIPESAADTITLREIALIADGLKD